MVTERKIKMRFCKKHVVKVFNDMLENTVSGWSRFKDHKMYRLSGKMTIEDFVEHMKLTKVGERTSMRGHLITLWDVEWKYVADARRSWINHTRFKVDMNTGEVLDYIGRSTDDGLDTTIRRIVDADCLVDNGTAISIYF